MSLPMPVLKHYNNKKSGERGVLIIINRLFYGKIRLTILFYLLT
jgi:hypothetical protein